MKSFVVVLTGELKKVSSIQTTEFKANGMRIDDGCLVFYIRLSKDAGFNESRVTGILAAGTWLMVEEKSE